MNRRAKVANLNADLLDGNSASAFLPVDGTAQKALNAARAAGADDADALDGHDSSYFQRKLKPIVVVQWANADTITVDCPAGYVAVGGGYQLAPNPDPATRDYVERDVPHVPLSVPIGWHLKVQAPGGVDGTHTVYAVCVE